MIITQSSMHYILQIRASYSRRKQPRIEFAYSDTLKAKIGGFTGA
jgi:hypothetical protein